MAEPFDTLIRVQEHDTALDQLRQRKRSLPARVELAEVEARLATVTAEGHMLRTQVEDLTARQRLLEDQIAAAAKRRQELELRMLTGGISASRDILAMDEEVQHLAERQAQFEEDELALVEEEDPLDVALAENVQEAAALEVEVSRLQEIIDEEVARIEEAITSEETQRASRALGLPAVLADRYEKLRSHLGGVGAARLVGDRCDGCHLALPSKEVERIHRLSPEEFATCDQCGRILVH
jgi:predicted  nucleic acid-binding Zn-ribbon protein